MEKTDKRFIYNDLLERNKRMNRLYLPTSFLLLSLLHKRHMVAQMVRRLPTMWETWV